MQFTSLQDWLKWQETLHPSEIELGLERVATVFNRLHPQATFPAVITVAGTNGKGSSVAMLEAIYLAAGFNVGKYTSPHLINYNERICVNGQAVDDSLICDAFERINQARQAISLTYFEFGTLAALDIFLNQPSLDVILLEVGLGGRLDAVNIVDPDVALVTSISKDHIQWLGDSIEAIAREKAGIMRNGKPAVTSSLSAVETLQQCARQTGAELSCYGEDFQIMENDQSWQWQSGDSLRTALPRPALFGEHQLVNAAGVLKVIELLNERLPVSQAAVREGLVTTRLHGRFQVLAGDPVVILDVAHNVDAASQLSLQLQQHACQGKTYAVLGMLSDKDISAALRELSAQFEKWFVAPLNTPRSESAEKLKKIIGALPGNQPVSTAESVLEAFKQAAQQALPGDRIVVFGSFYTVAEVAEQQV